MPTPRRPSSPPKHREKKTVPGTVSPASPVPRSPSSASLTSDLQPLTSSPSPQRLYLLSDSTGNLPRHILTAMLTQFPEGAFEIIPHDFLESPGALRDLVLPLAADPAHPAVLHAFVSPKMKAIVRDTLPPGTTFDLTGPLVAFLAHRAAIQPTTDPGRLHPVDQAYLDRIAALEFTLAHDDGLGLDTLHDADVVLAGISRTSKSPTCMYLAQMGIKAANVALTPQVTPPTELLALPPNKVVGLFIDPLRLAEVRASRQTEWNLPPTNYNDLTTMREEITWSRRLFRDQNWPTLDVSHLAIEETAARILHLLRRPPTSTPDH